MYAINFGNNAPVAMSTDAFDYVGVASSLHPSGDITVIQRARMLRGGVVVGACLSFRPGGLQPDPLLLPVTLAVEVYLPDDTLVSTTTVQAGLIEGPDFPGDVTVLFNTSLAIPVEAGQELCFSIATPDWENQVPTEVSMAGYMLIRDATEFAAETSQDAALLAAEETAVIAPIGTELDQVTETDTSKRWSDAHPGD